MKQTVFADRKGVRNPRKEYRANASPKKLNTNLISGQWVFEDSTVSLDFVIPWNLNTNEPVVVASLATLDAGPISVCGNPFVHPEYKKVTIGFHLMGPNGKKWLKKLKKKTKIFFIIDGR